MVEEVVAKVKLDTSDLSGQLGKLAGPQGDQMTGQFKDMQKKQSKDIGTMSQAVVAGVAIWQGIKKTTDALLKASPALRNTIQIFGQGLRLLLKPVGDLFSIILRPFALAFIKWAVPFYRESLKDLKTRGGKIGGVLGAGAGAIIGGAGAGAVGGALLGGGKIGAAIGTFLGGPVGTAVGAAIGAAIGGLIGIKFGAVIEEWYVSLKEFLDNSKFKERMEGFGDSVGIFFTNALVGMQGTTFQMQQLMDFMGTRTAEVFMGIYETIAEGYQNLIDKFKEMGQGLVKGFNKVKNFVLSIPQAIVTAFNFIKDFLTETIPSWFSSMFASIRSVWDNIKGIFTIERSRRYRSVGDAIISPGGNVITTDPKDFLIATKDPGRLMGQVGGGFSYSPNITVQATINNEMDVRKVAEKLAEFGKDELARRTSDFRMR